jgi:hypothetical protein
MIKEETRMSGFYEKLPMKSVKFFDSEMAKEDAGEAGDSKQEEFKFINSKPLTKMGIFNRKQRVGISNFADKDI